MHAHGPKRLMEFAEERNFFRGFGWSDKKIAAKLGIPWEAYRRYMGRHPELGPVVDPDEDERLRWIEFTSAITSTTRRRRSHA